MLTLYQIKNSDNLDTLAGIEMDRLTKMTMRQLGLHCFRSSRNRAKDKAKADRLYKKVPNKKSYAVHHMYCGLVGLVPRDIHSATHHNGYFYRLALDIED